MLGPIRCLLVVIPLASCTVGQVESGGAGGDEGGAGDGLPMVTLKGAELESELELSPSRQAPVPFRSLALFWTGRATNGFEVSDSADGEHWSEWRSPTRLHAEVEHQVYQFGKIDVPGETPARYFRLRRTEHGPPTRVQVRFLERGFSRAGGFGPAEAGQRSSFARSSFMLQSAQECSESIGGVQIRCRSSWTAEPPPSDCVEDAEKKRITVHHTAGQNLNDKFRNQVSEWFTPQGQLREIRKLHMVLRANQGKKTLCDIGYHFVIDHSGVIWEARPLELRGEHVRGGNTGNIGIALFGNYHDEDPPQEQRGAQLDSLARLVLALTQKYPQITLDESHLFGHGELQSSDCPGRHLDGFKSLVINQECTGDSSACFANLAGPSHAETTNAEPVADASYEGVFYNIKTLEPVAVPGAQVTWCGGSASGENGQFSLEPRTENCTETMVNVMLPPSAWKVAFQNPVGNFISVPLTQADDPLSQCFCDADCVAQGNCCIDCPGDIWL